MNTLSNVAQLIDNSTTPPTITSSNVVKTQIIPPKIVVVTKTQYVYIKDNCKCCNNCCNKCCNKCCNICNCCRKNCCNCNYTLNRCYNLPTKCCNKQCNNFKNTNCFCNNKCCFTAICLKRFLCC